MNKRLNFLTPIIAVLALASQITTMASSADTLQIRYGWYVGAEGGVPFGFGSFSSFGHDKTRAGYNVGLYGGYRFNPVLSAELSAKWCQTALSAHSCCVDAGYWLGADGMRYYAPVPGLTGWDYADIKSSVSLQQYGARLNVNLLGFFESTKSSRWTLDVSPAVYAVGTKANLKTIADDKKVMEYDSKWHFGYGGRVQAGYKLTRNLGIGIYSEFTALTGSRMDGVTENYHDDNFIWESGIRIGWRFGKSGKKKAVVASSVVAPVTSDDAVYHEESKQPAVTVEVTSNEIDETPHSTPEAKNTATQVQNEAIKLTFPTVYFAFNSYTVPKNELPKLQALLDMLNEHPDMQITLKGWCDKSGRTMVNSRISLLRAEAVKTWLVNRGIAANRVATIGNGSDQSATTNAKARRVEVEKQ